MKQLSNEEFRPEVLESDSVVLVDFYSLMCGPCRAMEPVLRVAEERHRDVKFVKIEAGEALEVFNDHRVTHVPTFVLFKAGDEVGRKTGMVSEKELTVWLSEVNHSSGTLQ